MVCAKCQRTLRKTELATPGVKRKSDIWGSPATSKTSGKSGPSATLGGSGVTKNKLASKAAKNPYAAYSSSCDTCKTKIDQGRTFCQRCAYKANACPMCGKSLNKEKTTSNQPVVEGKKFSAK